ncbi:MAG TPA: Na+/H+ antiporter NhaA [Thermoanaerobaculia bacterium]|nr:Na+/H+ antiporter NhaA [Thermoanaerobaculia bacterium]
MVARRILTPFQSFVRSESFGGVLLIVAAVVAFIWANSPGAGAYEAMKETTFGVSFGDWGLEKALILWVNDLLMAIFFLLVGLEIKREFVVGELSERRAAMLPMAAALGGMVVPALIYAAVNRGGPGIDGWGIPMATDIAFALGIMALLGKRVPLGLKVFLTALAIVDDLGAVLVIALFYTEDLATSKLVAALAVWALALLYGLVGGRRIGIFALFGVVLWYLMLKSGVHATVAGVLLAFTIPMRRELDPSTIRDRLASMFRSSDFERQEVDVERVEDLVEKAHSPLHDLEHSLQPWVAFAIMPIFALFNAGFTLSDDASLAAPVALGAFLGLLLGKPLGVALFAWLAVKSGAAALPRRVGWGALWGTGLLAGIGFTMSLFIATLGFGGGGALDQAKLGVLSASVVAAVGGLAVLMVTLRREEA